MIISSYDFVPLPGKTKDISWDRRKDLQWNAVCRPPAPPLTPACGPNSWHLWGVAPGMNQDLWPGPLDWAERDGSLLFADHPKAAPLPVPLGTSFPSSVSDITGSGSRDQTKWPYFWVSFSCASPKVSWGVLRGPLPPTCRKDLASLSEKEGVGGRWAVEGLYGDVHPPPRFQPSRGTASVSLNTHQSPQAWGPHLRLWGVPYWGVHLVAWRPRSCPSPWPLRLT